MECTEEDILTAIDFIHGAGEDIIFDTYCTPFLFGTENQEGISEIISYEDKDVITIASSGDQYISSVYYGANKVDVYDINRFTCYITYLKIAAFLTLSYEEFISFFMPARDYVNEMFWDLRVLKKVLVALPSKFGHFWEKVIYECKRSGFGNFVTPNGFHVKKECILSGMPFYYSEEEYYIAQLLLRINKYPNFIESDLINLGDNVKETYDVIYLSNIIENLVRVQFNGYVPDYVESETEKEVCQEVFDQICRLAHPDKETMCMVSYRANRDLGWSDDWLYNNDLFNVSSIESKYESDDYPNRDLVLTYKMTSNNKINIIGK